MTPFRRPNEEEDVLTSHPIYLLHLYREKSHWLIEGYDLNEEKTKIFSVNHLKDVIPYSAKKRVTEQEISDKLRKQEKVINLVIELGPKAIAQFKKYHPLKGSLSYTNPYHRRLLFTSTLVATGRNALENLPCAFLQALKQRIRPHAPLSCHFILLRGLF